MTYTANHVDTTHEWSTRVQIIRSVSHWTDTVPSGYLSQWKDKAIASVLRLSNLENDWDSYGSPRPLNRVVNISIEIIRAIVFDVLPSPHVVPVSGGGIKFEWTVSQRELHLEVLPDGTVEFFKAVRGEPIGEDKVENIYALQSLVSWLMSA